VLDAVLSLAGGEISGVEDASDTGVVVAAGGVVEVAFAVCAPRTAPEEPEPDKSDDSSSPVMQTGVPSDFSAHNSLPMMVLEAVSVEKKPWSA